MNTIFFYPAISCSELRWHAFGAVIKPSIIWLPFFPIINENTR